MQDPTSITATAVFPQLNIPQFPEQEQLKCPRCESNNTKFCYYNNYNLSQPRHYCKSCKRYWTKGGTLRNIPIGGGTRKTTKRSSSKRSSSSSSSSSSPLAPTQLSSLGISPGSGQNSEPETKPVPTVTPKVGTGLVLPSPAGGGEGVGSFTSLLGMASEGQFGNFVLDSLRPNGLKLGQGDGLGQNSGLELMKGNGRVSTSQGLIIGGVQNRGDQSSWGGSNNMWPDLAIYTQPGSKFQ